MFFFRENHESILEVKQKLLSAYRELESAKEERRNNEESIKQLLELLKTVSKERDEAREQVLKLQNKISHVPSASSFARAPDTSSFLSNEHSSNSFVDDCFTNVIPMQALADQMSTNNPVMQGQNYPQRTIHNPVQGFANKMSSTDAASMIIEGHNKRRPLAQKGKFYQAVIDVGPLLLNLLAAAPPLPRWKDSPTPFMPCEVDQSPTPGTPTWALNQKFESLNLLSSHPPPHFNSS